MKIIRFKSSKARKEIYTYIYALPILIVPAVTLYLLFKTGEVYIYSIVLFPMMTTFFYRRRNSILTQIKWNPTFVEVNYITKYLIKKNIRLESKFIESILFHSGNQYRGTFPVLEIKQVGKPTLFLTLLHGEDTSQLHEL